MSTYRRLLQVISILVILSMMFSGSSTFTASAQQGGDGIERQVNAQTGRVSFIGPESGRALPATSALGISPSAHPEDPGMALARRFGPEFGLKNPARDLTELRTSRSDNGRLFFHYQQDYQGIPVLGGELIVNTNENGDLYSINGEISSDVSLSTQPTIDSDQARQAALEGTANWYQKTPEDFVASSPELWIFDESLLQPSTRPVELVWRMEVTPNDTGMPVRELVLVNAETGIISLHFNQIDTAWGGLEAAGSTADHQAVNSPARHVAAQTAATWYVAATGSDLNSCATTALPCANIQKAISLAADNDVIKVAAGTYYHPGAALNPTSNVVILNKSLSLSGGWQSNFSSQTGVSIIDGQNTNNGISVTATGSTVDRFFVQNSTASNGGALYVSGAGFTLRNSTLFQNAATLGAGLFGTNNADITIINSTIAGNETSGGGAIYAQSGTVEVRNSTIALNDRGLSTSATGAEISLQSSIVWQNSASNCSDAITSRGYNILPYGCEYIVGFRDQFDVNPQLDVTVVDTLGYFPLLLGSPAIDAGPWDCSAFDQRGVARPQSALCDIGSYEYEFNEGAGNLLLATYDAENSWTLPGVLICNQTDLNCTAGDVDATAAHQYAAGTYNLYKDSHNRNSIDGNGLEIISSVHFGIDYQNAFWNGYMMVYGDEYQYAQADDIVAHELTHGVTQYESNLYYYYQSGAINESFSDLWGEYYDQIHVTGADTEAVKWRIGEDTLDPSMTRSMSHPELYDDPDKMSSADYRFAATDNGGVHHNSGINNKAVYLMVDGGAFNNKTVTALGWTKTAAIYYKANADLLTSGADYSDLYYALQQACSSLVGQKGITSADCVEVKDALDAVEMNTQLTNFNTDTPLCDGTVVPNVLFTDDLESGTGNWTFNTRWQLDAPHGQYAHSGAHSLYANDNPGTVTDAYAQLSSLAIPTNAYLRFAHAYDFDSRGTPTLYYDGGVLEYSIDSGVTWANAGSLINVNGYKGTIFTGTGNPLAGLSTFAGSSHGYISTRVNLASLAGKNVVFRWRMGLDEGDFAGGWWVDDVQLYRCSPPMQAALTSPLGATYTRTPTYTWDQVSEATYYYLWIDGPSGNIFKQWYTSAQANCNGSTCSVTPAKILSAGAYTWTVQTYNDAGYGPWSPSASFAVSVPGKATLTLPTGAISTNTPTYQWNQVSGAASYYLWVDGPSGNVFKQWYTSAQANCNGSTCSVTPAMTLSAGAHVWSVQTYNDVGYGPWSTSMSFTTPAPAAPGAATLTSPTGSITTKTPAYQWNQVSGATWYYLWVDGPSGNVLKTWYTSAQANCNGSTCSVTPTTALSGGAHVWKVQTWGEGGYGPWSTNMNFTVNLPTPPGKATLTAPTGTIATNTPTYRWNEVSGATYYYLWVDGPSGNVFKTWYTSAQANCNGSTCSVTPAKTLSAGAHVWAVQTYNDAGYGPWSTSMSFTVPAPALPGAATLTSPTGTVTTKTPAYTWNQVSAATWYYLWVDGPSGNVLKTWYTSAQANCNGSTCSVTPTTALSAGAYTWKVQTWNDAGYGSWSTNMSFTVAAPGKATLTSPNGSISSHTPTYQWNEVAGATYYYLWVDGPSGNLIKIWYTRAQANCNGTTCSVTPSTTLGSGAHVWAVQTWNDVGYGPWSTSMNFTTP